MKKLLILFDKIGPTSKTLGEFIAGKLRQDSSLTMARFSDLVFEIKGRNLSVLVDDIDISEFNLVYFRRVGHNFLSTAGTLALFLDELGIRYFDTKFREIGAAGDKFTSLTKLAIGGINIPQTMFLWRNNVLDHSSYILDKLEIPAIAKDYGTQRNTQIYAMRQVKDFEKLVGLKVKEREGQFLFQRFIKIEKEYRLLVLKDRVAVAHTKAVRDYEAFRVVDNTPEDSYEFINPAEIPDDMKNTAILAAKKLNLEVAGVDICFEKDTGKIYVLEVNRGPGFSYDPKFSPELPELAKFFAEELQKT